MRVGFVVPSSAGWNLLARVMKKIKWGVIGAGGIARRRTIPEGLVPARNAELTALYSTHPEVGQEVADQYNAKTATSLEALLGMDLDGIYIATPPQLHAEQTLACAQAGKHVLCEKPLGLSAANAESMAAACDQAGVKLGTAFMMRFHAQHQAALQIIRDGRLGTPVFARAQLSCWYPPLEGAWRQDTKTGGGGSLMDMGGHCVDLLEMFLGRIMEVSCHINRSVHLYASEDSAVATLRFENGALAVVDTFFCIPDTGSENRLELYGSKGSILAKGTIGQGELGVMTSNLEKGDSGYDAQQSREQDATVTINPTPVNMYRAEIEEFSQAILDNRQPFCDAASGIRSQRILEACYESAHTKSVVTLESW